MGITMDRRSFVKGAAAAGAAMGLAACSSGSTGSSASSSSSTSGDATASATISCYIDNPTSIDPFDIEEFNGAAVAAQLFDPLTRYDYATEELKPLTAESWDSNDSADTWTFHIKKGLKFHDGTDVTANSFKYAWNRICNPKTTDSPSVVSYHLALVKGYDDVVNGKADELTGITCPDDYTLKVELTSAYADFPFVVCCTPLSPIPDCAKDNFAAYSKAPVGNGPFMMDGSWEDGQFINMTKFSDYGGDEPANVGGVNFSIQKDTDTAFLEFQAGNLDLCDIPAGRIKETAATYGESEDGYTVSPGKQTLLGQVMYTEYLAYNVNDPILSNKLVRQAMSLAIDRQSLCDTLYESTATPSGDIVPPGIAGNDESTWVYTAYDVDKANALLDQAGYPADASGSRGITLSIMVNSSRSTDEFVAMQANWAAVGITVNIDQLEYATMLSRYVDGTFQLGSRGWTADYPIMDNFLQPLMYTGVGDNVSHYSSAEFDAKLDEARKTVDEEERIKLMHEADAIGAEDMPIIPILHKALNKVGSDKFQDLMVDAGRTPELRYAKLA